MSAMCSLSIDRASEEQMENLTGIVVPEGEGVFSFVRRKEIMGSKMG